MRDEMQLVDAVTLQPRVDVPGRLCRIVSVRADFTPLVIGQVARLGFVVGNSSILEVASTPLLDLNPTQVTFCLGGAAVPPHLVSTTPATGVAVYTAEDDPTGPLPDIWWGEDLVLLLALTCLAGSFTVTRWQILRELKRAERPGRAQRN